MMAAHQRTGTRKVAGPPRRASSLLTAARRPRSTWVASVRDRARISITGRLRRAAEEVAGDLKGHVGLKVGAPAAEPWERGATAGAGGACLKPSAGQCIGRYVMRARTGKPRHSGLTRAPGPRCSGSPDLSPLCRPQRYAQAVGKKNPSQNGFSPSHLKPI